MSGQFPTQGAPPSYDQPYASDASFAGFDQQHTEGPNEYTYLSDEYDYSSDESDYSSEDNVEAIVQRYDDLDYITVLDNWISSNMNPCCAYCQRVRCQSFRAIIKEFDFTNDELLEAFKDADALFAGDISDSHTLNRVASKTVYNQYFAEFDDFDLRWPFQPCPVVGQPAPMGSALPYVQPQQQHAAHPAQSAALPSAHSETAHGGRDSSLATSQAPSYSTYAHSTSSYNEPLTALPMPASQTAAPSAFQTLQAFQGPRVPQVQQVQQTQQAPQGPQAPQTFQDSQAQALQALQTLQAIILQAPQAPQGSNN